jgi:hypothetical protein
VAVANFPSSFSFELSDFDTSSDPMYFGYVDPSGAWYIAEFNNANCTFRYYKGTTGYTAAWADRENKVYDYYDDIF